LASWHGTHETKRRKKGKPLEKRFLFAEAGWLSIYVSGYAIFCEASHSTLRSVDRYLHQDKTGRIHWLLGPIGDGIELVLVEAMHRRSLALVATGRLFETGTDSSVDALAARLTPFLHGLLTEGSS
jgi:hypothetical protein